MKLARLILLFLIISTMIIFGCSSAKDKKEFNDKKISQAINLSQQGKFPEAVDILNKVVADDPNSFEAQSNLGGVYLKMKQFKPAIEAFEQAKKLRPNVSVAYYNIGGAYLTAGELDKAQAVFIELKNKFPNDSESSYSVGLSLVALERKNYTEAINILEEALKKQEKSMPLVYNMALACTMTGQTKKAEVYKARLAKLDSRLVTSLEENIKLLAKKK